MRHLLVSLAVVACGASTPQPHPASRTVDEWTQRCASRLQAAATKLAIGGHVEPHPTQWNPTVRFEAHVGGGYYEAAVGHGREPCADYDSDDPAFVNLRWSDGNDAKSVALHRIRRVGGDEGWVQADKVPAATLVTFRAAFEDAVETCLLEAQRVPLGSVPRDFSCIDREDRCPDDPSMSDDGDGCPQKK